MQYIYIDKLGDEDYQKYIDKLELLDTKQELTVIIHTDGGDNELCDILSRELSKFTIHIQAYAAKSCGMILLDRLSKIAKTIYISEYSIYMVHLPARDISIGMGGSISRGEFEKHCNKIMNLAKPHKFGILTQEEQEKYENGEDIYLMPARVKTYYNKD